MTPHRKQKITYDIPGHAHYLTFSCQKRLPLLSKDRSRQWVVDALQIARTKLDFDLWAYVMMPEHLHLLIRPRHEHYEIERILAAIKRPVSACAKKHLQLTEDHYWLAKLTVVKGAKNVFRFWLPGGGYDHNLWNDRPIYEVIEYIHANPVRRGLVRQATDWIWSSARFWAGDRSVPLLMDPLNL
jgi:putative transposase